MHKLFKKIAINHNRGLKADPELPLHRYWLKFNKKIKGNPEFVNAFKMEQFNHWLNVAWTAEVDRLEKEMNDRIEDSAEKFKKIQEQIKALEPKPKKKPKKKKAED